MEQENTHNQQETIDTLVESLQARKTYEEMDKIKRAFKRTNNTELLKNLPSLLQKYSDSDFIPFAKRNTIANRNVPPESRSHLSVAVDNVQILSNKYTAACNELYEAKNSLTYLGCMFIDFLCYKPNFWGDEDSATDDYLWPFNSMCTEYKYCILEHLDFLEDFTWYVLSNEQKHI